MIYISLERLPEAELEFLLKISKFEEQKKSQVSEKNELFSKQPTKPTFFRYTLVSPLSKTLSSVYLHLIVQMLLAMKVGH